MRRPGPDLRSRSLLLLFFAGLAKATAGQQFTEFPLPNPSSTPIRICAGPDGALWFTEYVGNRIGRITPDGKITEFPIPTPLSDPVGITVGIDRNLWFTESAGNNIGRITPGGVLTEFPIPTKGSSPSGIAAGADGALWFTEVVGNQIGRITVLGSITEFPLGPFTSPTGIAAGPSGFLWFSKAFAFPPGNMLTAMNTEGLLFDYPIPTPRSQPREVAVGPSGGIWFTEFGGNKIGRLGPDGAITEFPIPSADSEPEGITVGPDRNIWFVENGARVFVTGPPVGSDPQPNSLGRVTPDGVVTEFPIPTAASAPTGITTGPDGALWFTESASNKIGRFVPPPIGARSVEARELSFRVPVPFTNFAGKYRLSEDDSCGKHSEQEIIAFQTGNRLQFLFGVDTGGVVGTIQGALIDFDWREGPLICPNTLSGSGAAVGRTIRGIVAGVGRRCSCSSGISGPVTIAFTLTPE